MFDTMTMTKVIGGLCGTLLVFLLGAWLADEIYSAGESGKYDKQAYVIEVEGAEDKEPEVVEQVAFSTVFETASAEIGEGLWRSCRACHSNEPGVQGTGPSLYGVVDRPVQSIGEFGSYSGALVEAADTWTPENLNAFIENPRGFAPGTTMGYSGMRDVEDRANLIAYLASIGG